MEKLDQVKSSKSSVFSVDIVEFLISRKFRVISLCCLLVVQMSHSFYLYRENSHLSDPWQGYLYAWGLDIAILIFSVMGNWYASLIFLAGMLANNYFYYSLLGSAPSPSQVLIGLLLPIAIAFYTGTFAQDNKQKKQQQLKAEKDRKLAEERAIEQRKRDEEKAQKIAIGSQMDQLIALKVGMVLHPYRCPECDTTWLDAKALNGHISKHRNAKEWNEKKYDPNWKKHNQQLVKVKQVFRDHVYGLNGTIIS